MKTQLTTMSKGLVRLLLFTTLIVGLPNALDAQAPDCTTGTVMYGVFNQVSNIVDSTEFRSINFSTGAIGPLMGGRKFWIRKWNTTQANSIYGSSAMGLDPITQKFYVMTQMPGGSGMVKNIVRINTIPPLVNTDTGIVIATTPTRLNNYHFVKAAFSPNGFGYAIGVNRDTSSALDDTCNVLIRFSTCGATPSAGCANGTVTILGYLAKTAITREWMLYNGDISFDASGNLYFASSAFRSFGGSITKYTDARLFRINQSNIPAAAGTGFIPMSLVADFNGLDSTGVSGLAVDNAGNFYFGVRRYTNNNQVTLSSGNPGPFISELYRATVFGATTLVLSPSTVTPNFSIGDLGSCYFPFGVLADVRLKLSGYNEGGNTKLRWEVNQNTEAVSYQLQRSDHADDFETVNSISTMNSTSQTAVYNFIDQSVGNSSTKFYRVKQLLKNGNSLYSNVIKISESKKLELINVPKPNPFVNQIELRVQVRSAIATSVKLVSQSGATVYHKNVSTQAGENTIVIADGISSLAAGVYILEIRAGEEIIREKLIKR